MRTAACFHANQARRTIREVLEKLSAFDWPVHDLTCLRVGVVHLKHILRNVDSNWRSIHLWVLRLPGNACIFHLGTSMPLAREDPPYFAFVHGWDAFISLRVSSRLI
jgi:hypothetical protein